jgi:hypothetical protein
MSAGPTSQGLLSLPTTKLPLLLFQVGPPKWVPITSLRFASEYSVAEGPLGAQVPPSH